MQTQATNEAPSRVLSWEQVKPLVGVSRTTWWRMVRRNEAPAPLMLGARRGWLEADIAQFQAKARVTAIRARGAKLREAA